MHHNQVGFIPKIQGWFNICELINAIKHIRGHKDKNHMITSINAEKVFNKIKYAFMTKVLQDVGLEEAYLNTINTIYEKAQPTLS